MSEVFKSDWIAKSKISRWRLLWIKVLHWLHIRRMKPFIVWDMATKPSIACRIKGYKDNNGKLIIEEITND